MFFHTGHGHIRKYVIASTKPSRETYEAYIIYWIEILLQFKQLQKCCRKEERLNVVVRKIS